MLSRINYLRTLQIGALVLLLLYLGKALFIPLAFSIFISFIIYPWCKWFESKGISKGFSIIISLLGIFILLLSILSLFLIQLTEFIHQLPALQLKVVELMNAVQLYISSTLDINVSDQNSWIDGLLRSSSSGILSALKATIYASSVTSVLLILIPIYIGLILYYRNNLLYFLYHLFEEENKERVTSIVNDSILTYSNFVKGVMFVYFIVGLLNSLGLFLLGIPNPVFFGFVASILTIIPYVGIVIGAVLPVAVAWITHDSVLYPIGVVAVFTFVQLLEANIIFPLAVSNKLKINTLATVIVIVAGGLIWGVSGMILFLPFVAILKLIADKVPDLKPLSILLGTESIKR